MNDSPSFVRKLCICLDANHKKSEQWLVIFGHWYARGQVTAVSTVGRTSRSKARRFILNTLSRGPKGGLHVSSNLALACPSCNLHKSDRVTIPSPKSSQDVPLFNPRTSLWKQTFDWDDFQIIAKSEIGNATIHALDLNHDRRIRIRQAEKMFGLFPPEAA